MADIQEKSGKFEVVIVNALKIPGVKVDRKEFLVQTFTNQVSADQLMAVLDKGPIEAGVSVKTLNNIAKGLIDKRTLQSSTASFLAGIPGGLAMAATVPADTLQFFGVSLRLAQELSYIFGHKDFWQDDQIDKDRVRQELTLFLGVMCGVGGSAATLRVVSAKLSQQALKKLPQMALTKTIYYPMIKKIAQLLGIKMTKKLFTQGVAKFIPLLGGVISGGITYASMKPMGNRLREALYEAVDNYSEEDYERDLEEAKREIIEIDAEITELEQEEDAEIEVAATSTKASSTISVADELLKFKQLLDMGAISQEEFDQQKKILLNQNGV